MGQGLGTLFGLITAFAFTFVILTFGQSIPGDVLDPAIVADFLASSDLELKLAVVGTVLYPSAFTVPGLGELLSLGAQGATVWMFLVWGTAGLVAGLVARDIVPAIFAAVFAAIIGAFLTWLLVFIVQTTDFAAIFGTSSMLILQAVLEGSLYPGIATVVGGLLGGGISRER